MARKRVIIDCYTDEPAGLGVPPFLGVWPRYIAGGYRDEPDYLTIDDLRLVRYGGKGGAPDIDPPGSKTRIDLLNRTRDPRQTAEMLSQADQLIVIVGVQTPGKYLSARPGTLAEVCKLLSKYECRKVLAGPVAGCGTQLRGGAGVERIAAGRFDEVRDFGFDSYAELGPIANRGALIAKQIPGERIVEIETGRGCPRSPGCSFCTEPLKSKLEWRPEQDIIEEVAAFMKLGMRAFRLGRQSCIFSYAGGNVDRLERLLSGLGELRPEVLHIDNASAQMVTERRAELFVKYLTPGSTAALGAESFDPEVARLNNLNSDRDSVFEAIRVLNRTGGMRGENGCPHLLAGVNILLGLEGESRRTLELNLQTLRQLVEQDLLVRRINIRQVVPFPGTRLYERVGNKFLRKNRRLYPGWIEQVRREIDLPMLKRVFPSGTILRRLRSEVHQGQVTFLRQLGSYPIVVGVRQRLEPGKVFDVRVTDHMLRSLVGEVVR